MTTTSTPTTEQQIAALKQDIANQRQCVQHADGRAYHDEVETLRQMMEQLAELSRQRESA